VYTPIFDQSFFYFKKISGYLKKKIESDERRCSEYTTILDINLFQYYTNIRVIESYATISIRTLRICC
jgi:hypothetical protein